MATIHKLTKDGSTIFPATIADAVVHQDTGKTLTSMIKDYNVSELFPSEGIDGGNKYNLALAISVLGTHLTAAEKTGGISVTFISSATGYPEEEYFLNKNTWSTNVADWGQRFEVGDVIANPSGSWTPGTAEQYIDQKVAEINTEVVEEVIARQTGDSNLQTQLNAEVARVNTIENDTVWNKPQVLSSAQKTQVKTNLGLPQDIYSKQEVNGLVDTPHQNYVTVATYASLPTSGSTDTIYRVSNYDGSVPQVDVTKYSEYAWNGSAYVFLCVKSQIDEVFDISVYNNNATYADLTAALSGNNVPTDIRRGGMSVKFVQTSDNKYVQYRYMESNTTTSLFINISNWQGIDTTVERLSSNIPTSRSVYSFVEDRMSYTDLLYTERKQAWVNASNIETDSASFLLYYFDNIVEGQTLWLYMANNAAYVLFVDENDNIVGTPYSTGSTHSIWKSLEVPVGAKRLKVSNLNNLTTYPNGLPLRVLAHTNDDAVKEAINNLEEQDGELSEKVYDITGDIIVNNYDNDDLSNLVYSSNKYKVVAGFNTLIVPVNNGYSVKWNYTSTAEDAISGYYIDANEPVLNGTRDSIANPAVGTSYINTTGQTVWLVVTFKTSTSPTITATVELKYISKYGLDIISNKWIGKKMLCLGDSITDMGYYVDPLTNLLGTITYNRGYSGECLTDGVPGETHSTSGRVDLPASDGTGHHGGFPTEADLVTILTSANDWYHMNDIPLGEVTDAPSKTASFCSALHYLMQGVKSKYPSARIVVIIPYRIYSTRFVPASEIAFNTANDEASGFTFIKKRTEQITLDDLRDRMTKIASVYGADVIDLREVGFSFFWNYDREACSYITDGVHDGLHPSIEGGKIMAEYIAKHIISYN